MNSARHAPLRLLVLLVVLCLGLGGCARQSATMPPAPSAIPTNEPADTLSDSAMSPTTMPETLSCVPREQGIAEQLTYEGIRPGGTTEEELLALWGEPEWASTQVDGTDNWEYSWAQAFLQDGTVIEVSADSSSTVLETVAELGCPDLIFLDEFGEHREGVFNGAYLVYLERGVEVTIHGLPLGNQSQASRYSYFAPTDKGAFVNTRHAGAPDYDMDVTWEELVAWGR